MVSTVLLAFRITSDMTDIMIRLQIEINGKRVDALFTDVRKLDV